MNILDILYVPMGYVLRFAYSLTNNYLFAIFLFTLVMEIILSPIAIKQQKNMIKQARLAPKVAAIRKKYAGRTDQATQQKMQQETMEMYQNEKASPMGGCLPMLIQFPFIICIYNVVISPLKYLCRLPAEQITALTEYIKEQGVEIGLRNPQFDILNVISGNVSDYYNVAPALRDATLPNLQLFGLDLTKTPEISLVPFNWLMLILVITFVVMVISTKIMQKLSYRDPMMEEQQSKLSEYILLFGMPAMSIFIEYRLAAVIGIYWIFRNVVQLVEKLILAKVMPLPKISKEEYEAAEREMNMSNKQKKRAAGSADRGDRPFVRSLHHIDDEEYIARHADDLKALEEEKAARENYRPKLSAGKSTSSKKAPAPIKNDEKTSYEEKKEKEEKKK